MHEPGWGLLLFVLQIEILHFDVGNVLGSGPCVEIMLCDDLSVLLLLVVRFRYVVRSEISLAVILHRVEILVGLELDLLFLDRAWDS